MKYYRLEIGDDEPIYCDEAFFWKHFRNYVKEHSERERSFDVVVDIYEDCPSERSE